MKELDVLYRQFTGENVEVITELSASGSNRKYFRLQGKSQTLIGVAGTSAEENRAFVQMSKDFHQKGLLTPVRPVIGLTACQKIHTFANFSTKCFSKEQFNTHHQLIYTHLLESYEVFL